MMSGEVKGLGLTEAVREMMGKDNSSIRSNGRPRSNREPTSSRNSPKMLSEEALVESPAPKDKKPLDDGNATATSTGTSTPSINNGEGLPSSSNASPASSTQFLDAPEQPSKTSADVIFRPSKQLVLDTNDVNVDFERRTKGAYTWSVTTSVAHVWFNAFFEDNGPEQDGQADDSGVFEIEWDKMDGIKGSNKKGTRAFDKIAVVWKEVEDKGAVEEPKVGEGVKQKKAADWRQDHSVQESSDEEDQGVKPYRTRE
jgi:hypothetical protein